MQHTPGETVTFTRAGVRALDRAAAHDVGIPGIVLMENAAVALRQACLDALRERSLRRATVCCGPGNNGGDGLALARHLHNQGLPVRCLMAPDLGELRGDAGINLGIARRMGVTIEPWSEGAEIEGVAHTLVVDALLGTGLDRALEGVVASCARWINEQRGAGAFVIAVDVPTGLDADTGQPLGPVCVRAHRTVTLAGMKAGFTEPEAGEWTGEVLVGDIGAPTALLRRFGLHAPGEASDAKGRGGIRTHE